jgi:hypothetical protein
VISTTNSDTNSSESTDIMIVPVVTTTTTMKKSNNNNKIPEGVFSPRQRPGLMWIRWIFRGFRNVRHTQEAIQKNTMSINARYVMNSNTSHTTTTTTSTTTSSFIRLARERRFDEIIQYLQMEKVPSSKIYDWLKVHQESRSSTCECLHAICMYRPNIEVVQVVRDAIETHSRSTNALKSDVFCIVNATLVTDALGRTPLHVAVACGCSYKVVDALLYDDHEAVYMMDHTNRYPLHWACCFTPRCTNKPSQEKEIDNIVRIINRLIEIYAMAVISIDERGCTPMDLAISHQADNKIIQALQFVTNILPTKYGNISSKDHYTYEVDDETKVPQDIGDPNDIIFLDDISSIGSRGVSKGRRIGSKKCAHQDHCPNSASSIKKKKRKELNLIFI